MAGGMEAYTLLLLARSNSQAILLIKRLILFLWCTPCCRAVPSSEWCVVATLPIENVITYSEKCSQHEKSEYHISQYHVKQFLVKWQSVWSGKSPQLSLKDFLYVGMYFLTTKDSKVRRLGGRLRERRPISLCLLCPRVSPN